MLTDNLSRSVAMYHKVCKHVKPEHLPLVADAYDELINNGFAEKVPNDEINPEHPTYVLTSRPVLRLDKSTTKCRIVINASLPDQKNRERTLNKLLMPGKNMLPQIMELVMQSKCKRYLVTIDIQKMFLSVNLANKSDKDMLRFVWAPVGSESVDLYRFRVLAFGIISSPFIAMRCLKETAKMFKDKYPKAAEVITEMTYMDDIHNLNDTIELSISTTHQILEILQAGGFNGHKITANDPRILDSLEKERVAGTNDVSILGLKLDHETNEFRFDLDDKFAKFDGNADVITRRDIVKLASQVFDTQGYVSPFVMQYKKILPLLWSNGTKWDENLRERSDEAATEAVEAFHSWIEQIPRLKELRFPRFLGGKIEFIAVFGDASKTGMGVVAYAVARTNKNTLEAQLLYSKSTLMPKALRDKAKLEDLLTIARAELIALNMAVTMGNYIQNALKPEVNSRNTVYLTDSLLNLQRIQRGKGKCKPWEERRVCNIIDNKGESNVRFCPGVLNPADLPSRGCDIHELLERLTFWNQGPSFLVENQENWPKQPLKEQENISNWPNNTESDRLSLEDASVDQLVREDLNIYCQQVKALRDEEFKSNEVSVHTAQVPSTQDPLGIERLLSNCSKINVVKRVLIRIKRLFSKRSQDAPATTEESDWADLLLVQHEQSRLLSQEAKALREKSKSMPKNSCLRNLPVLLDENDVIRLKSRFHTASTLAFDYKNPAIIPKGLLAEKLVLWTHQSLFHCSQRQTFNTLRRKYWFIGGFGYVKELVRKLCKVPRCRFVKFASPMMAPLPSIRIDNPRPWKNVGIDYLGPLTCAHECSEEGLAPEKHKNCPHPQARKIWMSLFTCFHTRAIHVEIVEDCSTRSFMNAFRRFVGRFGKPITFYSDNARHFIAANKQLQSLKNLDFDEIQKQEYRGETIEWKFSTPEAPWTNGVTERMIGIFKRQFKILLQREHLTLRALETLIIELIGAINDRPLGVIDQDPNNWSEMISPNMLQFGRNLNTFRTPEAKEMSNIPCSDLWIQRKRALNHFWTKWKTEYLQELSVNKKWQKQNSTTIKEQDIVLLKPETLEKNQWRLARVVETFTNDRGEISTVTLKLPNSSALYRRSIRQIALLESAVANKSKDSSTSDQETGCVGGNSRLQTVPTMSGLATRTEEDFRSPGGSRPCHDPVQGMLEAPNPEESAAAALESVPLSKHDQEHGQTQNEETSSNDRSKRKRHHRGFYKSLHQGK